MIDDESIISVCRENGCTHRQSANIRNFIASKMMPLTTTKDGEQLAQLTAAINAEWARLYPGAEPVSELFALVNRVKNIGADRDAWIFNARVLQKKINEMEVGK